MPRQPPELKIKFVFPGDMSPQKRKRLTPEQAGIIPRLEHLYAFKALIERLFGNPAFVKIGHGVEMP
jgi:hypothetical protein